tara:strand:- start:333 stop:638 length:306 start_codon:yes stop_codon:yes gene_type:complete
MSVIQQEEEKKTLIEFCVEHNYNHNREYGNIYRSYVGDWNDLNSYQLDGWIDNRTDREEIEHIIENIITERNNLEEEFKNMCIEITYESENVREHLIYKHK